MKSLARGDRAAIQYSPCEPYNHTANALHTTATVKTSTLLGCCACTWHLKTLGQAE